MNPALHSFPMQRSLACFRKGDFTRSLTDIDEAIRLRPWMSELHRLRAKSLDALHENDRAAADRARAEELAFETFPCPEDIDRIATGISIALRMVDVPPPPLEAPETVARIAPPPVGTSAPAAAPLPPTSSMVGKISVTEGWTLPKATVLDDKHANSRFLAPVKASIAPSATDPGKSTAPPPPLVVAIPTEIPAELSLPPGASLPSRTDPNRLPPPLVLPTSAQESPLPPPKR